MKRVLYKRSPVIIATFTTFSLVYPQNFVEASELKYSTIKEEINITEEEVRSEELIFDYSLKESDAKSIELDQQINKENEVVNQKQVEEKSLRLEEKADIDDEHGEVIDKESSKEIDTQSIDLNKAELGKPEDDKETSIQSLQVNQEVIRTELKLGDIGQDVLELKLKLERVGFFISNKPTYTYGPSTEKVVRDFQEYYGIKVTGVADTSTLKKLDDVYFSPFQLNNMSGDIYQLKLDLERVGFRVATNPSFTYGPSTEEKVKEFQHHHGLVVNGIADEVTLNKLKKLIAELDSIREYKLGDSGQGVLDLKLMLNKIGFFISNNPTFTYGPSTEKVVRDFQSYFSLPVTGVANRETINKIEETFNSPYQLGNVGIEIYQLKLDLEKIGFKISANPTYTYGPSTESVVKEFQKQYGLRVTGIGDEVTLNLINELVNIHNEVGLQYKLGDSNQGVLDLKLQLNHIGFFVAKNPTYTYGPSTEKIIKEFQEYFGLPVTGIADSITIAKIDETYHSPYQLNKMGQEIYQLKLDLAKVGYFISANPTLTYGPSTVSVVKQFQNENGLRVTGIVDEVTYNKIQYLLENGYEFITYTQYSSTFTEATNRQMALSSPPQTDKYRFDNVFIHSSLLNVSESATLSCSSCTSINLRTEPSTNTNNVRFSAKPGEAIKIEGEVNGAPVGGDTKWYIIEYNGTKSLYVHNSLVTLRTAEVKSTANIRQTASTSSHSFGSVAAGTTLEVVNEVTGTSVSNSTLWYELKLNRDWRNATRSDVQQFMNPSNVDIFQHLILSHSIDVTANQLNSYLTGRGTLAGHGSTFLEAGRKYSVNQAYLVAHAVLETGHGRSTLAQGVYVDTTGTPYRDNSGRLITDPSALPSSAVKVYNMFGIAAFDNNPINGAARYAFQQGWTSPSLAIDGGAKWISDNYINSKSHDQNTVYKMRWNPNAPGTHQYATDIGWANKQISIIKTIYSMNNNNVLRYDIPQYN